MLYQNILGEYHRLQTQIEETQQELAALPNGKLTCAQGSYGYKWYHTIDHTRTYLPKSKQSMAEQLAVKKYLKLLLKHLEHEKTALEFYLRHHSDSFQNDITHLTGHPGYQELLASYFQLKSDTAQTWANAPYDRNMKFPEHLVHKTSSGIDVRSKSEAMIALFLHTNRIPFRYECALNVGGVVLYPDFTIMHPKTSKIYYWEHFGLMDDPAYVKNVGSKLQLYMTNGIIPSIQLITTYETKANPLNYDEIVRIGTHSFLR